MGNAAKLSQLNSYLPGDETKSYSWRPPSIIETVSPAGVDFCAVLYGAETLSAPLFDVAYNYPTAGILVKYNDVIYISKQVSVGVTPGVGVGWDTYWLIIERTKIVDKLIIQNEQNSAFKFTVNGLAQANSFHGIMSAASAVDAGDGGSYIFYPRRDSIKFITAISNTATVLRIALQRIISNERN